MTGQPAERCIQYQAIIDPNRIHCLRFVLEAYEGVAVLSTLDPNLGLVLLSIAPGCEEDVLSILDSERTQFGIRSLCLVRDF